MNGNGRQIKISPTSPSALPSSHLLTRPCAQSDHFFSYDSATDQSDHRTNISYKKIFYSYDCGPIPSYDFTHNAPRSPHDSSTKAPPWGRRASHPDTNHWLLPPPSSVPIGTRPQAGSKLQSDQNPPRKSATAAKASQPDTKSPALPPALPPACPPLFRP